MKKLFILLWLSFYFSTSFMLAQSAEKKVFKGNLKHYVPENKWEEPVYSNARTGPSLSTGGIEEVTVLSEQILVLPNAFGYMLNSLQKQLASCPSLNAVTFINRQDPATYGGGNSGHLRYSISTDKGISWTKGLGVTNADAQTLGQARYPESYLFANGGNTLNDLKLTAVCPVLDASGVNWNGHLYNSITSDLTNTNFIVTQEDYVNQSSGLFSTLGITEQGNRSGVFWRIDNSLNDDNYYVFKGSFNGGTQKTDWVQHSVLSANWNEDSNGDAQKIGAVAAFSPDGNTGYIVALGDIAGGHDSIFQPVVWEYNLATDSWGNASEIDINVFPQLSDYLQQWVDTAGVPISNGLATTGFSFDVTVDVNGNPHIITLVGAASVGTGSPQAYAISTGFGMQMMDISKDEWGDWNMITISPMMDFAGMFGTGTNVAQVEVSTQISRTEDGKFIFYTWTDSDTTGNSGFTPDLWGSFYDVENDMISPAINWTTNDPVWTTRVLMAKTAQWVFETPETSPCQRNFTVPVVTIDPIVPNDITVPHNIHYFKDIAYSCASSTLTAPWFHNCKSNPLSISVTNTEPGCGASNGMIDLQISGGTGPVSVTVSDINGNNFPVNNNLITGLAAGIYEITLQDSMGCTLNFTNYLINNNGAVVFPDATNPTCGLCNGEVIISSPPTGSSIVWYPSGSTSFNQTQLCPGNYTYLLTDANQCVTPGNLTLTGVAPLAITASITPVSCNGGNDGEICVSFTGGTPLYSYSGLPAFPCSENLTAGIYLCILTDALGCEISDTLTVTEPPAITATTSSTPNSSLTPPWTGTCTVNASGGTNGLLYSWAMTSGSVNVPFANNPGGASFQGGIPCGVVTIVISDSNQCSISVQEIVENIWPGVECLTSITNPLLSVKDIRMYPNPAYDYWNTEIQLLKPEKIMVKLTDIHGKEILSQASSTPSEIHHFLWDVRNQAAGMYLMMVYTEAGTLVKQWIKQ